MPKLLIVTTVASTLKAFLLPYARHFRALGWQVDALARGASSEPECLEAFDACHEAAFTRRPWQLKNLRAMNQSLRDLVSRGGYDIVHVHTPVASFVTRMALRKLTGRKRPRVVYTAHGFHFFRGGHRLKNLLYFALEQRAARWTDYLIVINQEDYDAAFTHALVPPNRLALLPGIGLDLALWNRTSVNAAGKSDIRQELGLAPSDKLFLMVAEFNPGKRHRDALEALAIAGRKDLHLAFAGRGPLEEAVRERAATLGLLPQVHFLGQRNDVPALMLASLATVLPSEREGLNRSVMESIALGVPVLGADARGIRDLVTTPSRGALFPVGKPAALAADMLMMATDPPAERPTPNPRWDVKELLRSHEQIYSLLLKERG